MYYRTIYMHKELLLYINDDSSSIYFSSFILKPLLFFSGGLYLLLQGLIKI